MTTTPQAALLSDDEIERHFENNKSVPGRELRRLIGRSIEAAILAKLQATQAEPVQEGELPPLPSSAHWEERIKTLMQQTPLPNSMSVYQAFKQFQNEFEHATVEYARAALSARKPLNSAQIRGMAIQEQFLLVCDSLEDLTCIVREVERAHGIGMEVKP